MTAHRTSFSYGCTLPETEKELRIFTSVVADFTLRDKQTYHCYYYPNNCDQKKWHQYIADCRICIFDGRRCSGAVHCIWQMIKREEPWWSPVGPFQAAKPLHTHTVQQRSLRLFMLHPCNSCDFHMVSPPSLISEKSEGTPRQEFTVTQGD